MEMLNDSMYQEYPKLTPVLKKKITEFLIGCTSTKTEWNISFQDNVLQDVAHAAKQISSAYLRPTYSVHRLYPVKLTLQFFYIAFSLLGLITNVTVIVALLQHKALANITNLYIFCLALSDIILCSLAMPGQAFYEIIESTYLPLPLCKVIFALFGLPLYISCLTILLIAIDRHRMIVYPLSRRMRPATAILLVLGIILFSVVNSSPVAIYTDVNYDDNIEILSLTGVHYPTYCIERWPSKIARLIYSILMFGLHFFVPLIVSACLYVHIYICLNRRRVFKQKEVERKKRTNRILMLVVVFFAICWAPWCIFSLLLEIQNYLKLEAPKPTPVPLQTYLCTLGWKNVHITTYPSSFESSYSMLNNSNIFANVAKATAQSTLWIPTTTKTTATLITTIQSSTLISNINNRNTSIGNPSNNQPILPLVEIIPGPLMKLIDLVLKLFAMCSAVVNPFLYGWLNEPIRESMCKMFSQVIRFIGLNSSQLNAFLNSNYNKTSKECGLTITVDLNNTRKFKESPIENENKNGHNTPGNCQYSKCVYIEDNDHIINSDSIKDIIVSDTSLNDEETEEIASNNPWILKIDEHHGLLHKSKNNGKNYSVLSNNIQFNSDLSISQNATINSQNNNNNNNNHNHHLFHHYQPHHHLIIINSQSDQIAFDSQCMSSTVQQTLLFGDECCRHNLNSNDSELHSTDSLSFKENNIVSKSCLLVDADLPNVVSHEKYLTSPIVHIR